MKRSGASREDVCASCGVTRPPRARRRIVRDAARWARTAVAASAVMFAGCYSFSSGGGLPRNLRSVAVQPFDNQTAVPELQREILEQLRRTMRERLSLRDASEQRADVIVRGTITRYEVDLPAGASADPRQTTSTRRRAELYADVEIVDQKSGRTLFKQTGSQSSADYAEGAERTGRRNAIESFVNKLIDGMQSQW